ncbi:MAG: heavy metal-binding domain-containing protein [Bacteroidota bacterium]
MSPPRPVMPFTRLAALVAVLTLLSGCANRVTEIIPLESGSARLGHDLTVTTGDLDRPYDEVALLRVNSRGHGDATEELVADLRAAARRVDADAVVRVDFDPYGSGEDGTLRWAAVGTAVRFR